MTSILHPEEFKNVEAWIQHVGKEIMRDEADLDGLATLTMTHAFGRTPWCQVVEATSRCSYASRGVSHPRAALGRSLSSSAMALR